MDKTSFTFLNTTNAPGLSQQAAKRVRGHVTKANFSERRQRMARLVEKPETDNITDSFSYKGVLKRRTRREDDSHVTCYCQICATSLSNNAWLEAHHDSHYADMGHRRQALLLLACINQPRNKSETAWVNLIVSEPALVEATMVIGMRLWSPRLSWQRRAGTHQSKALNLTIQKIGSKRPQTEAMLAAVSTMAFAERLANDDLAWNIHIDGLAQMIKERQSQDMSLPWWLHDIIVLDSINHVFNFPRVYHRKVIDAIDDTDNPLILQVTELCENLIQLRTSIDMFNKQSNSEYTVQEIEALLSKLLHQARNLRRVGDNKAIHATAQTVEIILYILWPGSYAPSLQILADELKETLLQLPVRGCSYMDFTSCQHLIGAMVAQRSTSTQGWFVNKLTTAAKEMRFRGWDQPFEVLEKGFRSDARLTEWLRILRNNGLE